jgi:protease PrsW
MGKLFTNRGFLGIIVLVLLGSLTSVLLKDVVLELHGFGLFLFSLLVSIGPGLLWLYFFYLQDKHEREPHHFLVGVFILGAALSYGVSIQMERLYDAGHDSSLYSTAAKLLTAILVYGVLQEIVKFLVVRYTVYNSSEFNEPADGAIYCIAAGLGSAAAYNMVYLNSLNAFALSVVPVRIIEYYLVSAVIAGIMGYFMGKAKFAQTGADKHLITGFVIAIVLNGLYSFFSSQLHGLSYNVWGNLAFTVGFVVVLFGVMFYLLQQSLASSPFSKKTA